MDISLIFKIAAVGNTCFYFKSGIKTQRQRRTGISCKSGRTYFSVVMGASLHL